MAFLLHGYLHVQHENDKSRSFLLIVSVELRNIATVFYLLLCLKLFVCVCVCVCVCVPAHIMLFTPFKWAELPG